MAGAERLYLTDFLRSGVRGKASASATGKYTLLEGVNAKGQEQLALSIELGDDIISVQRCGLWELDATTLGIHLQEPRSSGLRVLQPNSNPPKEFAQPIFNNLALS